MPYLYLYRRGERLMFHDLLKALDKHGSLFVGRKGCPINVDDASIAPVQFELTLEGDGFRLTDRSGQGTVVGSNPVDSVLLRNGDRIEVGRFVYFYHTSAQEDFGDEASSGQTLADPFTAAALPRGLWVNARPREGDGGLVRVDLRDKAVIGSAKGCDLVLAGSNVSGHHAEVSRDGDVLRLRDLDSTNGTRFCSARVTGLELPLGARVQIGAWDVWVSGAADPKRAAPKPFAAPGGFVTADPVVIGLAASRGRRRIEVLRAHHRRDRHRQGAVRESHPRAQPPLHAEVHQVQLRRGPQRGELRHRSLRPREGLVHRRHPNQPRRAARARRRHRAARRDRRAAAGGAAQPAAGPRRRRDPAPRRHRAHPGGRALHRRHETRPHPGRPRRPLPRRPLLPPQHHPLRPPAVAPAPGRHPPALGPPLARGSRGAPPVPSPPPPCRRSSTTPGPATSASCTTSSSAPSPSAARAPSSRPPKSSSTRPSPPTPPPRRNRPPASSTPTAAPWTRSSPTSSPP